MAIRMPLINQAKQILQRSSYTSKNAPSTVLVVPKGNFEVYVGKEEKKQFMVPVSFLSKSSFQDLLSQAEEEYGYNHPIGGLTIPCSEDIFLDLTSRIGTL